MTYSRELKTTRPEGSKWGKTEWMFVISGWFWGSQVREALGLLQGLISYRNTASVVTPGAEEPHMLGQCIKSEGGPMCLDHSPQLH